MRRFRRDPLRARIESYGRLPLRLYKKLDRDIRFPFDPLEWWTYVGLRGAAAGAAVMLGAYRALVLDAAAGTDDHGEALASGVAGEFAHVIDDRRAMAAAYRVAAWAYMAEMTAKLWAPRYDAEMQGAARALLPLSRYEEDVRALGSTLLMTAGGAQQQEERLGQFRREVSALMVSAATGAEPSPDASSLEPAATAWLESYRDGREVALARVRQLAPKDVPGLRA
jgi:hypothetical protein